MKRTITRNGQSVDCYGIWEWDSNAVCVWETDEGGEDGYFVDGAKTWEEAVETMTAYTKRIGVKLVEMTAC